MESEDPYSNPYVTNKWSSISCAEAEETGKLREETEMEEQRAKMEKVKQKQAEDEKQESFRKERQQRKAEAARVASKKSTTKGKSAKNIIPSRGTLTNFFTSAQKNHVTDDFKPSLPKSKAPKGIQIYFSKSKGNEEQDKPKENKDENRLEVKIKKSSKGNGFQMDDEISSLSEDDLIFEESKSTQHTRHKGISDFVEEEHNLSPLKQFNYMDPDNDNFEDRSKKINDPDDDDFEDRSKKINDQMSDEEIIQILKKINSTTFRLRHKTTTRHQKKT